MRSYVYTAVLLVFIAATAIAYVAYRYSESTTAVIENYFAGKPAPATVCVLNAAAFDGALENIVSYLDGPNFRGDWRHYQRGRSVDVHTVSTDTGATYRTWSVEAESAVILTRQDLQNDRTHIALFTAGEAQCRPWWFPNGGIFKIPDYLEFISFGE